ncbi:MAG: NAD(P)H-binding protein [Paracoccus sp. (in: a-proteobacteria)]
MALGHISCRRPAELPTPASQREIRAIDAAKAAGVGRIVKISASDSNVSTPVPWAQAHARIDHHLRASGPRWTILKPTAFMQNFLWFKDPISRGFLPQTSDKGCASWVDNRDVARTAVTVLTNDGHDGATYFLTGPEALDIATINRRLGDVLGRRVRFVSLPKPGFQGLMRAVGNSSWMAKELAVQFADVVAGHHAIDPTSEIERLTGRPPHDFDRFASDHRARFPKAA